MGRISLKEYKDLCYKKITLDEYKKICWDYGRKLEENGWKVCPIEGGCLSPDISTIYIYNRSPYEGELLNFIPNTEDEYKKICEEFIKTGEFIDQDNIWYEMALKDLLEQEKKLKEEKNQELDDFEK